MQCKVHIQSNQARGLESDFASFSIIVETMEEYMSLTHSFSGHFSITYDKYFMMLQNACIRYDITLKQKPSKTSKAVYQHELDDPSVHDEEDDYLDDNTAPDGVDTPSDDMKLKCILI